MKNGATIDPAAITRKAGETPNHIMMPLSAPE
jgi:hypothetical protein